MAKFTEQEGVRFADLENETVCERFEEGQMEPSYLVGGNEYVPDTEWNNANNDNPLDGVFKYDASHGEDTIYVKIEDSMPVEVTRELDEIRSNVEYNKTDTGDTTSVSFHAMNAEIEVKYDSVFKLPCPDVTIDGKQAAIYDFDINSPHDPEADMGFKAVIVDDNNNIKAYEFIAGENGEFGMPQEIEYKGENLIRDEDRQYTIKGADSFEKDCAENGIDFGVEKTESEVSVDNDVIMTVHSEEQDIDVTNEQIIEDVENSDNDDEKTEIKDGPLYEIRDAKDNVVVRLNEEAPYDIEVNHRNSTDVYYDGFHVHYKIDHNGNQENTIWVDNISLNDGKFEHSYKIYRENLNENGDLVSCQFYTKGNDGNVEGHNVLNNDSIDVKDILLQSAFEKLADKVDISKDELTKDLVSSLTNDVSNYKNVINSFIEISKIIPDNLSLEFKQEKMEMFKEIYSISDKIEGTYGVHISENFDNFDKERQSCKNTLFDIITDISKSSPDAFDRISLNEKISELDSRVDEMLEKYGLVEKDNVELDENIVERVSLPESLKEKADDTLKEKYEELSKIIGDFEKKIDYFKDDTSRAEVVQECLSFIKDNFGTDEITAMVIDKMEPEKYATEIKYKDQDVEFSFSSDGREQYADVYKEKDGERFWDRREVLDTATEKHIRDEFYTNDAKLGKVDYLNEEGKPIFTVSYTEKEQVDFCKFYKYDDEGNLSSEIKQGDIYREDKLYKPDGSTERFLYMPTSTESNSLEPVGKESLDKDGRVTSVELFDDKLKSALDTIIEKAKDSEMSQDKIGEIQKIRDSIESATSQDNFFENIQKIDTIFVSERDEDAYKEKIETVKSIEFVLDKFETEISKMDTSKFTPQEEHARDTVLAELSQLKKEIFDDSTDKAENETVEERYERIISSLSGESGDNKVSEILSTIEMADNLVKKEFPELEEDKKEKVEKESEKELKDKPNTVADAIKSYLDKTESAKDADSLKDDKEYQNIKNTYEKYMEWKDSLKESIETSSGLIPKSQDFFIARDRMMVTKYERALCFIAKDNPEIAKQLGEAGFKDGMGSLKDMYKSISAFNRSDLWATLASRAIGKFLDSRDNLYDRPIFSKEDVKKEKEMTREDILNKVMTSLGNVDKEGYAKFETDVFRAKETEVDKKDDVEKKESEEDVPKNDVEKEEDNPEEGTDQVAGNDEENAEDQVDTEESKEDELESAVEQEEDEQDQATTDEQQESRVDKDENEDPRVEAEQTAQADGETSLDDKGEARVEVNPERESQTTTDDKEDEKKEAKVEVGNDSQVDSGDSRADNKEASVEANSGQEGQTSVDDKQDDKGESKVSNEGNSGIDSDSSKEDNKENQVDANDKQEGQTATDEQASQVSIDENQEPQTGVGDQQGSAVSAEQNAENAVSKEGENADKTTEKDDVKNLESNLSQGDTAVVAGNGGSGVDKEDDEIDVTEVSKEEVVSHGSASEEIYAEIKEKIGEYIESASEKDEDGYRTGDVEFSDIKDAFEENGIEFNADTFTDRFTDFFKEAYNEGISFAGDGVFSIMENAASQTGVSFLELCDDVSSALDKAQDGIGDVFYENLSDGISLTNIDTPDYDADIRFSFGDTEFHITANGDDVDVLKEVNGSVETANIDATTLEDALLDISRDKLGDIFADNLDMVADNMVEMSNGEIDKADAIMSVFENTDDVMALTDHALDAQQAAQMAAEMTPQKDDHQDVEIDPEKLENLQGMDGATEAAEGLEAEEIVLLV